jgi:hypothetical protein
MTTRKRVSRFRYLRIAGTVNTWFAVVFLVFTTWIIYLRLQGEDTVLSYFFLCLVPLAAGTGLLSAGRRGQLDLVLGAGATRSQLWWSALGYAWGIPAVMATAAMWLSGQLSASGTPLRLSAVLLFAGGVSFCVGLVETRYLAGVLWLLSRFVFFITPGTMNILRQIDSGTSLPAPRMLVFAAVAAPECALSQQMPPAYPVGGALLGLTALVMSHYWFRTAEFGGKRS